MFKSPNILFVQKADVLETQKNIITKFFNTHIPDAKLAFASEPNEITLGQSADILIAPTVETLDEIILRLKDLRWIHFLSAGVEKIWPMQFDKSKYLLSKSSGVHGATMSEFAIGAMLFFEKSFNRFIELSREHRWERSWLGELTNKNLVVLGLGHIGQEIAKKASAFDMNVSGSATTTKAIPFVNQVVELNNIANIIKDADYIVVCLPLTEQTKACVNRAFVQQCKPGCVIIDISRGGVVSESAILYGLDNNILKGAALDVFETQPLPSSSKLWDRPDVLLTPHVSGTTQEYLPKALNVFYKNYQQLHSRGELSTAVNPSLQY